MQPDPTPARDELTDAREIIDRVDREFVRLLAARMAAVGKIAAFKRDHPDAPLRDEDRERRLFDVWSEEAAAHGLSSYFTGRVLREILNYSRRDQERRLGAPGDPEARNKAVRVAYQGVPGSYSDLTITKIFSTRDVGHVSRTGFRSFGEAMDALEADDVDYALLPIENTIAGSINEVYDLIATHHVVIVGEEIWPVEHCLVGLPGSTLADVRVIRSHPVALQQCHRFLDGLVGCVTESYHDTAGAAQAVAQERRPEVAAIASEEAAQHYGLAVLRRNVSDQRTNLTRFLLIGKSPEPFDPRIASKTSLVFTVKHHHGALLECLQALDRHDVNLTKLESRPQPAAPWEYRFYVDLEGHADDPIIRRALAELREHTTHLKVLGSYPARTLEQALLRELEGAGGLRDASAREASRTESATGAGESGAGRTPRLVREPSSFAPADATSAAAASAAAASTDAASAAPTIADATSVGPSERIAGGARRASASATPRGAASSDASRDPAHALAGTRTAAAPPRPRRAATDLVRVGGVVIGGERFVLLAGARAAVSRAAVLATAELVKRHGGAILAGGVFEPRAGGLGDAADLELLVEAGHAYELPVLVEVRQPEDVRPAAERADMLKVGAGSMQSTALLRALGKVDRPVLLERGVSATLEELLHAAELVLGGGNSRVVLCERGIRTFEPTTPATLDLGAVPLLKERTHLPVVVDPTHAAGRRDLLLPLALAAAGAGADGLVLAVDAELGEPATEPALAEPELAALVAALRGLVSAVGRSL